MNYYKAYIRTKRGVSAIFLSRSVGGDVNVSVLGLNLISAWRGCGEPAKCDLNVMYFAGTKKQLSCLHFHFTEHYFSCQCWYVMLTLKVILPCYMLWAEEVLIHANVQEPVAVGGGGSAKIIREAALQGTVPQAVHEELPMETLIQNNHLANYSGNEHSHELTAQMGSITSS